MIDHNVCGCVVIDLNACGRVVIRACCDSMWAYHDDVNQALEERAG